MGDYDLRLNCTRCTEFTRYEHERDVHGVLNSNVVRCSECGKKHSSASLYMVDIHRQYERTEDGTLLEDLP